MDKNFGMAKAPEKRRNFFKILTGSQLRITRGKRWKLLWKTTSEATKWKVTTTETKQTKSNYSL